MSTIAGYVARAALPATIAACTTILASMRGFGTHYPHFGVSGPACFGRTLFRVLPEDDFDHQPLNGAGGRYLMVADARIDNRAELGSRLAWSSAQLRSAADADLLMAAWERWELTAIDHVLGDIALAVWDNDRAELTLARTPLSNRPLFHHDRADHIAFASMPSGLLALDANGWHLNVDAAAALVSGTPHRPGSTSMFAGISAVPQGHAVIFRGGARRTTRLWNLDAEPLRISVGEAGEALRADLDRAVAARLRRRGGRVACQLSAGRDSGAVAASAALQLKQSGEHLIALTSAPRLGFADGIDHDWLADESEIAARAADRGGMEHLVCRPDGASFGSLLDRHSGLHFEAIRNPANLPWLDQISRRAAEEGASVLLNGAAGNFTISAGGTAALPDYLRERGAASWWRLARGIAGRSPARWRHMLHFSLAPFMSRGAYAAVMATTRRRPGIFPDLPTLSGELRQRAEELRREAWQDRRPERGYRAHLRTALLAIDQGEKSELAMWGIDVRDPTSDRRLAELCQSLPIEAYVAPGQPRPAYAAAFGQRLLPEVIEGARAGYQSADWFEFIDPVDIASAFDRYFRHPAMATLFDRQAIDALIASWPSRRGYERATIERYNNQLLRTMSLASFVAANFPDG